MPTHSMSKRPESQAGTWTFCCDEPIRKSAAVTAMRTRPIENSTWSRCGRAYIRR